MKSFYLGPLAVVVTCGSLGSMLSAKPVARLLGTRRDYYSAPYRVMSILGTHLGHIAMSDLSPKRDPKRTLLKPHSRGALVRGGANQSLLPLVRSQQLVVGSGRLNSDVLNTAPHVSSSVCASAASNLVMNSEKTATRPKPFTKS
jgi:hypothetical protein